MSRILAIDWDRREIRALVLQSGATGTSVAGAWAAPLPSGGDSPSVGRAGSQLAAMLAREPLGKVTTIIGVGRDHVQMKLLALPPAPPEELPELVRFQAEREFTALGDESALDFLPLVGDAQTPHQVLAVALSAAGIREVRDICQAVGVEPDRIALRACAAASCVRRAGVVRPAEVVLVISPLADEADLTVVTGGQVVLMRTVRLPDETHPAERQQALAGEIRRTLASTRHQLTGRQVDRVYLRGHGQSLADQAEALADELELPVDRFDLADHAPSGLDKASVAPEHVGRFAGVLGMALDEADRLPPAIDFLHIRRQAERARFGRVHALAAGVVVVAAMAMFVHLWRAGAASVQQRETVLAELNRLRPIVAQYDDVTSRAGDIEGWLATDVNWLEELKRLSEGVRPEVLTSSKFPAGEDIIVKQLTFFRPASSAGGQIDVDAIGRTAATATLEQRLRDEDHLITSGPAQRNRSASGYEFSFDLGITVAPPETPDQGGAAP
jgi:Tfp pilus assembly PilM family ATPase